MPSLRVEIEAKDRVLTLHHMIGCGLGISEVLVAERAMEVMSLPPDAPLAEYISLEIVQRL